jgi:RNA polymerase sigma factor (TIGR02999 family)
VESRITQLVRQVQTGDQSTRNELIELVYPELRRIARIQLSRERRDHTLQPTALVHEAYLRLFGQLQPEFNDRAHLLAVASKVMRRVLVDHARLRAADRRGGNSPQIEWNDAIQVEGSERPLEVLELNRALDALAREHLPVAEAIEMQYFAGMTAEEIAEATGRSVHAVRHQLRFAQAWLRREMASGAAQSPPAT